MINIEPKNITQIFRNGFKSVIVQLRDGSVHKINIPFRQFKRLQKILKNVHN